jgi:hypothetical protein
MRASSLGYSRSGLPAKTLSTVYSASVESVSQSCIRPDCMPRLNQRTRCADDAVRERLRHHGALGLLLDAVVADGRRGREALVDVARIEQAALAAW